MSVIPVELLEGVEASTLELRFKLVQLLAELQTQVAQDSDAEMIHAY